MEEIKKRYFKVDCLVKKEKLNGPFTCGEVKDILINESIYSSDQIEIEYDDAGYTLEINRRRLETDEELNDRLAEAKRISETFRKITEHQRYEQYLELKKEFENKKK